MTSPLLPSQSAAEIATVALYLVGGQSAYVDTEDIAIKAYELAPEKFSWRKHRDRIDLEATRVALRHATEAADGPLVSGGAASGWMLTPNGLQLAARVGEQIPNAAPRRGSEDARLAAERDRIKSTAAWRKFAAKELESINVHDFRLLLRVNEYFPPAKIRERISMLENAAQTDPQIVELLRELRARFEEELVK